MRILDCVRGPDEWKQFLADPTKHWRTGYSARTLAHAWEAADGLPKEVQDVLEKAPSPDLRTITTLLAVPEFKVELPGGDRPSQNDLFVLARSPGGTVVMMVEGKVAESFGPTLKEWGVGSTPGKVERWKFLCATLGLATDQNPDLRYQLFHRTASAVIQARQLRARYAVMIVHSFSVADAGFGDFSDFVELFGAPARSGELVRLRDAEGITLFAGWVRGAARFLDL